VPVLRVIRPEGSDLPIDLSEEKLMLSPVAQVLG
jgi:hypothetical protein